MEDQSSTIVIPDEVIFSKILLIRKKQVILDKDLAEFYQVETKQLKRAVRRNIDRFPVVRDGRLVGFLSRGDMVRCLFGR